MASLPGRTTQALLVVTCFLRVTILQFDTSLGCSMTSHHLNPSAHLDWVVCRQANPPAGLEGECCWGCQTMLTFQLERLALLWDREKTSRHGGGRGATQPLNRHLNISGVATGSSYSALEIGAVKCSPVFIIFLWVSISHLRSLPDWKGKAKIK